MSHASPAKEPSMEEILASIRKIIESGDERPSLPGLSEIPRDRPGLSQGAAEDGPTSGARLSAELDAGRAETPTRLFQPANGVFAEPDPFDELASWEFSPVGDAGLPARDEPTPALATLGDLSVTSEPVKPLDRGEASPDAPVVARTATREVRDILRTARASGGLVAPDESPSFGASLAEAYQPGPAAPAIGGTAPLLMKPEAETDIASSGGASLFASLAAESRALQVTAVPSGRDDPSATPEEDGESSDVEIPDFSLEFDDGFEAELRGEVEADRGPVSGGPRPAMMAEVSTLMSVEAGAEVAAAFDDLARAIRDGHMKSMDEMAREMLRPMLQEWLDDNLPRLVEKLVREEIERVARGGRR